MCVFCAHAYFDCKTGLCQPASTVVDGSTCGKHFWYQKENARLEKEMGFHPFASLPSVVRIWTSGRICVSLCWCRCIGRFHICIWICKHREQLCHGMALHRGLALVKRELNQVCSNQPYHCDVLEEPFREHPGGLRGSPIICNQPL